MDMSLGRRTASGIIFTPSGLSFTFTEKSSTGERSRDRRASETERTPRTPRGGARRKLPKKASETELRATLQNSEPPAIDAPWEEDENHWFIYDPYRDMRLDIDDMSYEELLDLGERIGTVSTAVSEEDLSKCFKRSKFTSGDSATCSICQEEFVEGDELGEVACGHVYHATCIEQWLKSKNWCPLCKGSATTLKNE